MKLCDLQTEYLENPQCIDTATPRFSWKVKSNRRGVIQKSYRIEVLSGENVLWNSGEVMSQSSCGIRYEGFDLKSRQKVSWKVTVTAEDENGFAETARSENAYFTMGLLESSDWQAKWIEPEGKVDYEERKPAPYLRKTFEVKAGLKEARIYQTAHGLYHFWLNGRSGTDECFKPGLTSYYYRIQYQSYDVTHLLQEGKNAWTVMLGDGWWRGVTGGTIKNNFGYKLHFLGQLELHYEDGTSEIIGSDESFLHRTGGMLASDMLMGDVYDAAKEPEGWKLPEFDDSAWERVHLTEEHADATRIASVGVPVREKEHFLPQIFTDENGKTVLDFGQNIAGYVKMKLRNTVKGQKIVLTHGEDIKDGCFSIDNVKNTPMPTECFQQVTYLCGGKDTEEYTPLFSVFGFRYVMLEGYETEKIEAGDFVAVAVYSDMKEVGDFRCSNPLVNKLVRNSRWSQKGNYLDVAVDCPTRERNAWTGDNQIYVKTAADFMNVYPFYEKWLKDQAIEQYGSGKVGITFPSTSSVHNRDALERAKQLNPTYELAGPEGNGNLGEDSVGWGDSTVWIPYMLYLCYGEKQILQNHYETARRWVDYMTSCAKEHNPLYEEQPEYHTYGEDGILDAEFIFDTRMHYGEWNEPIPSKPDGNSLAEILANWVKKGKPEVATAYLCRSAKNLSHMAQILGKKEDEVKYSKLSERVRGVYEKYMIDEDGVIQPGHQAPYVRALVMNLCGGKRDKAAAQLLKEVEDAGYKLNTGFLSTPFLLPVLVDCGYTDAAFRILEQTENPGWLHAVTLGATTILERWEGMDVHADSFNHYSYGAVCDFLFSYVAGICPMFSNPGYQEFELKPVIGGGLTYAEAEYECPYGKIYSHWERTPDGFQFLFEIPENTTAHVTLPDGEKMTLGSGAYQFHTAAEEQYEIAGRTVK